MITKNYTIILLSFLMLLSGSLFAINLDKDENALQSLSTKAIFLKDASIKNVEDGKYDLAVDNIKKYIIETGDFSILEKDVYLDLSNEPSFKSLVDRYLPKFEISTFFYFYVGLIGFFIAFILNLRRKTDRVANALIGLFVFMHSFFLIHVSLYLANYVYYQPHTLSMSTVFSFMYGPVLYFYFKRISENYTFKNTDLLHLAPTLIFIIVFIPIYSLPAAQKLEIMLGVGQYNEHPYLTPITIIKLFSLLVYGYLTFKVYRKNAGGSVKVPIMKLKLQKTIMIIHSVYALFYGLYGLVIIQNVFTGFLFNIQLIAMTSLVLYVGYVAYANPQVLVGVSLNTIKAVRKKYKNSGLTPSFSLELKEQLISLLEDEKVYRQNTIKLESIAQRLGTTRHNASQVINEHFDLNFFELINKYRVEEAMKLLKDNENDLNIIDIAYEVGYNNKVTFNKSFKRFCNLTPSQFAKLGEAS